MLRYAHARLDRALEPRMAATVTSEQKNTGRTRGLHIPTARPEINQYGPNGAYRQVFSPLMVAPSGHFPVHAQRTGFANEPR
jgi:hypothetical protein